MRFWAAYQAYMKSHLWQIRREAYFARHPRVCRACGTDKRIQLHHVTYERLGKELDGDLVPLCYSCHKAVHRSHNRRRGSTLRASTEAYVKNRSRKRGR